MTITTSQSSYWRGETKAIYTGKGWGDVKSPELVDNVYGNEGELELASPRADEAATKEVVQTVTVLRKDKLPVLFGAGPVSQVSELKSDNNAGLRWNPEEWELRWSKPSRVQSYSVISNVVILDEEALRKIEPSTVDARYLELPDTLPQRVRDLAIEQTVGLTNNYDRAKKLEQYLKDTFPYTNTPDVTKQTDRANGDIVDAFLFEIQEGYCDYFSTSFVVMARSLGIPTRWVKGYATGFDPNTLERARFGGPPEEPDPSGAGTYTVRNADAHSWAEVYFEGYGWIPFEPTSGFSVPQPVKETVVQETSPEVAVPEAPVEEGTTESNKDWLVLAGAAGVVLIILVLVFIGYRSRRARQLWNHIRNRGNTPNQRVVREMERLLSFLHRQGLRRESHETIRETFDRWGKRFTSLHGEFEGAAKTFEKARYGSDGGSSQMLDDFNEAATKIRKAL
jgi:transglutaminase-like putative cysteine protease